MNHITGCVSIDISAFMFSMAHWGKSLTADLIVQVLAALFLMVGLAMVIL
jgi:hypothetical protein